MRHRAPFQSSIAPKGIKLLSSISTKPTQMSNNENLLNRRTWKGYPVSHTRVTLHLASSPGRKKTTPACRQASAARCSQNQRRNRKLPKNKTKHNTTSSSAMMREGFDFIYFQSQYDIEHPSSCFVHTRLLYNACMQRQGCFPGEWSS